MTDLNAAFAANRAAVSDMLTAADAAAANWTTPRAPGKWSPSQVVEHVARAYEESANAMLGQPSKLPRVPGFLRPLLRVLFFNRAVRKGGFGNGKTNKAMDPQSGPESPAAGKARLEQAVTKFEEACRMASVRGPTFNNGIFGVVALADYVRFQELHTRHHTRQIPLAPDKVTA